jgi:hypothetical protein
MKRYGNAVRAILGVIVVATAEASSFGWDCNVHSLCKSMQKFDIEQAALNKWTRLKPSAGTFQHRKVEMRGCEKGLNSIKAQWNVRLKQSSV